jgi:hypothetical protein
MGGRLWGDRCCRTLEALPEDIGYLLAQDAVDRKRAGQRGYAEKACGYGQGRR